MSITSVNFAVLLIDDFSGKIINSNDLTFAIDGKAINPLKKDDGFYVFIGNVKSQVSLYINASKYIGKTEIIDSSLLPATEPVVCIRMIRKPLAYFENSGALIKGTCKKLSGENYIVRCYGVDGPILKLSKIESDDKKSVITVTGFTLQSLKGLHFSVGEGKNKETFVITSKITHNTYELDRILKLPHKSGEMMTRVYTGISEKDGSFSVFVDSGQEEKINKVEYSKEGTKKWACLSLTALN